MLKASVLVFCLLFTKCIWSGSHFISWTSLYHVYCFSRVIFLNMIYSMTELNMKCLKWHLLLLFKTCQHSAKHTGCVYLHRMLLIFLTMNMWKGTVHIGEKCYDSRECFFYFAFTFGSESTHAFTVPAPTKSNCCDWYAFGLPSCSVFWERVNLLPMQSQRQCAPSRFAISLFSPG